MKTTYRDRETDAGDRGGGEKCGSRNSHKLISLSVCDYFCSLYYLHLYFIYIARIARLLENMLSREC